DRAADRRVVATGLGDQSALDEVRDGGVGRDAADAGDVRPRAGAEVGDDRERLERRLREVPLCRLLEEPRAGDGRLARRPEGPAAGDVLEHDAAPALAVPLAHEPERRLDALDVVVRCVRELLRRQRLRGHDEERLERPGELVERVRCDQAERSVHEASLSTSGREILIGANGPDCSIVTSPNRRRSRSARKATACSTRESDSTSWSKSKRERRFRTARNRSTNCDTGGNRSAMWFSETCGGSFASSRITSASRSGCCGASGTSTLGASGAGPSRKKRSPSVSSRSRSHWAASFILRYSARRRASSSAAASGSNSASSAASSGKRPRAFSSRSAEMRTRNSPHASRSSSSRSYSRSTNASTMPATSISDRSSSSFRTSV